MKEVFGVPVSSGIAIGCAFLFTGNEIPDIPHYLIKKSQIEDEWGKFVRATETVAAKIRLHLKNTEQAIHKEQSDILKAHLMMVEDIDLHEQIQAHLQTKLENVEWAVRSVSHEMTQKLLGAKDALLRERAVDIADISHEILNELLSIHEISLSDLSEDVIVVAHDLLPSQAITADKKHVKALVCEAGGKTSHVAILARSFEIPAIMGVSNATREIHNGDLLIVNSESGAVIINPDEKELKKHRSAILGLEKHHQKDLALSALPAETKDGIRFSLNANIELPSDVDKLEPYGAEGIGLFRTEFLFLAAIGATGEETQYDAYSTVIKAMNGAPVKIRTCDAGGDKILPEFFPVEEKNPLLGWRAIRFSLAMPEVFKAQLRAILRAGVHGNAEIIFPLVSGIEELDKALALLEEAKEQCRQNGDPIAENIKVGVMIEVPSAALTADILIKKVDFFSIGTNDLVQYSLAVDRGNEKVSYLASPTHPAILRLIKMTIEKAHQAGKKVSLCGEMAASPFFTPLLIGLGLDEFSMHPSAIPRVKSIIRNCLSDDCKKLAQRALKRQSGEEVNKLLEKFSSAHLMYCEELISSTVL
ncbi:MAG: phosphoenolpyruvate--protein phosphotransferase [Spirochaetaceae bacterium]|jgi:phosphotransferase system enzyme I (PtsI)|nr:phosphoenolpyruvate--protein phosphotransferase [Spirochaetaceae bacterium]